jgi:hypothetical protein
MDKVWACHKVDGKLKVYEQPKFVEFVKGLPSDNLEMILRRAKSKRSAQQNKYYWAVVVKILSEETGNDPEDIHDFIKLKFNPKFVTVGNEQALTGGSTTELGTKEFEEKMEEIRAWASIEQGIEIPEPNGVEYE